MVTRREPAVIVVAMTVADWRGITVGDVASQQDQRDRPEASEQRHVCVVRVDRLVVEEEHAVIVRGPTEVLDVVVAHPASDVDAVHVRTDRRRDLPDVIELRATVPLRRPPSLEPGGRRQSAGGESRRLQSIVSYLRRPISLADRCRSLARRGGSIGQLTGASV